MRQDCRLSDALLTMRDRDAAGPACQPAFTVDADSGESGTTPTKRPGGTRRACILLSRACATEPTDDRSFHTQDGVLPKNRCRPMNQSPRPMLPLFLDVSGKPCLVVGAGNVAQRKIDTLVGLRADVTVVAPVVTPHIEQLHRSGAIAVHRRPYAPGEAGAYMLVFAATGDRRVNEMVSGDAEQAGRLVNVVDQPDLCGFYSAAVLSRGALQIAISSTGEAPAVVRRVSKQLEEHVPVSYAELVERLGRFRRELRERVPDERERGGILRRIAASEEVDAFLAGDGEPLERLLRSCVCS